MNELTLVALGATTLLGAAALWIALVDRRRQRLQQRLRAVVAASRPVEGTAPMLTLRRRLPGRGAVGLYRLPALLWAQMEVEFEAAGKSIGIVHLLVAACFATVLVFALANRLFGLNPAFALLVGAAVAPVMAFAVMRLGQSRYRERFLDKFPDALDLICRAVRAGLPVTEAMTVAAGEIADPVGSEMRRTLDEMRLGVEAQDALQRTAERIRVPDFRFFVVTLALQRRTGGSLSETLGNLSNIIRARRALRLKARALSAENKASAFVLSLLPFIVGGLLYLINPGLMHVLFTDPRGRFMLGAALVSLGAGAVVMNWIIKRSLR
jgi:Flp pilus assembly protein TadB